MSDIQNALVEALRNSAPSRRLMHTAACEIETLEKRLESERTWTDCWESLANECKDRLRKLSEKMPKWIPVTERLPEDGAEVLAWSRKGFAYVDWFIDGKWKVNGLVDDKHEFVTHWMPLPDPPEEVEA